MLTVRALRKAVAARGREVAMAKHDISVTVNGTDHASAQVESRLLLVHLLRENLRLTGTHIGCDTTHCGACTVLLDGVPVKSCTVLAVQADGRKRHDRRGAGAGRQAPPHPGRLQAGARPAVRLLHAGHDDDQLRPARAQPGPGEDEIRQAISGNLCRCTGYVNIVKAVQYAAAKLR